MKTFTDHFIKFQEGKAWLEERHAAGTDVGEDYTEFMERVALPMDALWQDLGPLERKYWLMVDRMAYRYGFPIIKENYMDLPPGFAIIV
jgi:hypothetical protein